jgi:hypothetical protein
LPAEVKAERAPIESPVIEEAKDEEKTIDSAAFQLANNKNESEVESNAPVPEASVGESVVATFKAEVHGAVECGSSLTATGDQTESTPPQLQSANSVTTTQQPPPTATATTTTTSSTTTLPAPSPRAFAQTPKYPPPLRLQPGSSSGAAVSPRMVTTLTTQVNGQVITMGLPSAPISPRPSMTIYAMVLLIVLYFVLFGFRVEFGSHL